MMPPADPGRNVATPQAMGRASLLRDPSFLKLWSAQTISVFGSQVSALAIPLVAAIAMHIDPFAFALLGTIQFLPFVLFALPAGAWVDRLRRRPILITGDLGRALFLATIPLVYLINPSYLTIWQLYVVGFATGTLTVFFDVADRSYLPSVVESDELIDANSRLQISESGAQIAGPGIAGYLVSIFGAPLAILVDSASFVASALLVFLIRRPEPTVIYHLDVSGKPRRSLVTEVREGIAFVVRNPAMRSLVAGASMSNLFANVGGAIVLLYVVNELRLKPEQIGLVLAIGNLGTLAGAVLANRLSGWFGLGPTLLWALFVNGLAMLLVAVASPGTAIPLLIAAGLIGGSSQMIFNINQVSYRQAICPPRMQGRMNATVRFIAWGTIPIGNLIGGALGSTVGLHNTIWVSAILGLLPVIFPFLSPVRSLQEMPRPVADDADAIAGPGSSPSAEPGA